MTRSLINRRRRRRVLLATSALIFVPLTSLAQVPARRRRIGYIVTGGAISFPLSVEPFKRGMRELGYREARDFVLELRTAGGDVERLPGLVAELVHLNVDILVVSTTPAAQAAKRATTTIPIVVANAADPVASGLAKSLAHPSGNVTGLSTLTADLGQKQLEILRIAIPNLSKLAVLVHPAAQNTLLTAREVEHAAKVLSIDMVRIEARDATAIERAFDELSRAGTQALIVPQEGFFVQQRQQFAELGLKHRIPTMFGMGAHVEAGGFISLAPDIADNFRRAASYVDRILKGAKPGDIPIEQPTKFELLINVKTAKSLRLTIPSELRVRADRLIE